MKLVIQIPGHNEEATLPATLGDLPTHLPGFDTVEWLVIDDGSSDRTGDIARAHHVHRVVRFPARRGLARAFETGLREALDMGADVVALRLTVLTTFSYTLETIIQAGQKNIALAHVPVRMNPKLRESRLFTSITTYVQRSLATMLRVYMLYQPLRFFLSLAALFLLVASALFVRFFFVWLEKPVATGHVQSLLVGGVCAIMGVLFVALGVLADLTAMNRRLLEEIVVNTRTLRAERSRKGGSAE